MHLKPPCFLVPNSVPPVDKMLHPFPLLILLNMCKKCFLINIHSQSDHFLMPKNKLRTTNIIYRSRFLSSPEHTDDLLSTGNLQENIKCFCSKKRTTQPRISSLKSTSVCIINGAEICPSSLLIMHTAIRTSPRRRRRIFLFSHRVRLTNSIHCHSLC